MDLRLEKALDFANYQITLANEKQAIKQDFLGHLVHYDHKGKFVISIELMCFCKLLIDSGNTSDIVLIDDNDSPILIPDLQEFYDKILTKYFEKSNKYYSKYTRLTSKKSIGDIIGNE